MVSTRGKKFLPASALLAAAICIAYGVHPIRQAIRFARLSSPEKKVVGEWKTYSIGGVIVNTLRADHTWTSVGGCLEGAGPTQGWWKVDGRDIIYEIDQHEFADMPKIEPFRRPIQEHIDDDRQVRSWADQLPRK